MEDYYIVREDRKNREETDQNYSEEREAEKRRKRNDTESEIDVCEGPSECFRIPKSVVVYG